MLACSDSASSQAESALGLPKLVRRNLKFKTISELIARTIQFLFLVALARALGASGFATYSYAVALGFIFSQFSDLGLQLYVTRELALNPARARQVIGTAMAGKAVLMLTSAIGLVLCLLVGPSCPEPGTVLTLALATLLASFAEFLHYTFRGFQRLEFEAGLVLTSRLLGPGLCLLGLLAGASLRWVSWAILISNLVVAGLGYWALCSWFVRPSLRFSPRALGHLLRQTLPLGLAILFSALYTRVPVVLLQSYGIGSSVAWFSAAHRLADPLQLIPAIVMAAVFPAMSAAKGTAARRTLGRHALLILLPAGALVGCFGFCNAPKILTLVYGTDFAASAPAFQWLMIALLPAFLNYALTHFLIAAKGEWLNASFMLVMLVGDVFLNLWLIPRHGARGSAIATVLSEIGLLIACGSAIALWHGRRLRLERI
jgi:O-antigen/teichoic acid export membrane protein